MQSKIYAWKGLYNYRVKNRGEKPHPQNSMSRDLNLGKCVDSPQRILLRVDGSHHLGVGHIMRCIALAQGFNLKGLRPIFIIRNHNQEIIRLIQRNNYDAEIIPRASNFIEDASLTLGFAHRYGANAIIIDLVNSDTVKNPSAYKGYLEALKSNDKFLITIDGFDEGYSSTETPASSDISIIPYFGAENKKFNTSANTVYLLGPGYFIFRQEFIKVAKIERSINKKAQNILVTMGGSDPFDLTTKVVKALVKINRPHLNLRVVIGPGFNVSTEQKLKEILRDFKGIYKLLTTSNVLAKLMLWSDITITSSGLTKYETAVTGTPTIVISFNDFQAKLMDEFKKCGTTLHLGERRDIREDDIVCAVKSLLDDYNFRSKMSKNGKKLVDGRGVERIISRIHKELFP